MSTSPAPTRSDVRAYRLRLEPASLAHYGAQLDLPDGGAALLAAARVVARGAGARTAGRGVVVARSEPRPTLHLFAPDVDVASDRELRRQLAALPSSLGIVRRADWDQVTRACRRLAGALVGELGGEGLAKSRWVAVPRGGFVALGLLAGQLGVRPERLQAPDGDDAPTVVVDDFAFSGRRLVGWLETCTAPRVILATLFSPVALRRRLEISEPRVVRFLSGDDVLPAARSGSPDETDPTTGDPRCEHLCLPWKEPHRFLGDAGGDPTRGWPLLPPGLRWEPEDDRFDLPIQQRAPGPGPLRPAADVEYAVDSDGVWVSRGEDFRLVHLEGSAAVLWRTLDATGSLEAAADAVARAFDVGGDVALTDARIFLEQLVEARLMRAPETATA